MTRKRSWDADGKMAARAALGAWCRRLWQAGTGQAGGTRRARRDSCPSVCLTAVVPATRSLSRFYSASRLVCRTVARKGLVLPRILSWDKTEVGAKAGTKRMAELDRMLNIIHSSFLPFYVCKISRGSGDGKLAWRQFGAEVSILPAD